MKVLQIIDSLDPGGAERMAVNYANLLYKNNFDSHICVTRKEGLLKDRIALGVFYIFLDKKSTFDIKAILNLRNYIKEHKIDILHAHGTSYFLATFIKISYPSVKLIWHDHYGNSEFLNERKSTILKYCSKHFDGVISVNAKLKIWSLQFLHCKKVIKVNNFINANSENSMGIIIKGDPSAFKIICVANLRPQKDHINLLNAFEILVSNYNMSLHLIGNDPQTTYSKKIIDKINNPSFKDKIFYYGSQKNVIDYLENCDLGVLSSISEGLPLAILEYGISGIAVVTTNVGQCEELINGNGKLVSPKQPKMLADEILFYYKNKQERIFDAKKLNLHVLSNYSEECVAKEIIGFYSEVINDHN
ncbi:glycosyltransferase involved in cell wall biosynthesis [Gillisia mitskevichiae]|uniref:Glycosyltransferase involved in cell wall biosynthesis n=1 Tax=Gillisia mitskevichiae TaxID=270921 RepID=A0A495P8S3_9FLAO|nr:glycosyltransferase [Gillisia mitskevichiae]RKS45159.1 glycosyltransferase involved in cell wall biosynthesis [Gillisia mitskevichiae]